MNSQSSRLERLFEPHVLPSFATVERFVDAIAPRNTVSGIRFAGSHPYDVRIALGYLDVADGNGVLVVELMLKRNAVVGRF